MGSENDRGRLVPISDKAQDDESVSSEDELVRNPDAAVSESDDDNDDDDAKRPAVEGKEPSNKKKHMTEEMTLQVEFIFCDMAEKYFHGLKSLLHCSSVLCAQHSSSMADSMTVQNVSVGTVFSTASAECNKEGDVFGFASVFNVTT